MQNSQSKRKGKDSKPEVNSSQDKHRINEEISVLELRLIAADGSQLGVVSIREALRLAYEAGLDLVEVAPQSKPPVCKLIDYGKLKYREQKRDAESRKKGVVKEIKELWLRYNTDEHDIETKVKAARKFLAEGIKVRFLMRFHGREVVYEDLANKIFDTIIGMLVDIASVDERTPLLGKRMALTLCRMNKQ